MTQKKKLSKQQKKKLELIGKKRIQHVIKVVEWIYENESISDHEFFEYPEYADMPTKLHDQLSSIETDLIQENWKDTRGTMTPTQWFELFINA